MSNWYTIDLKNNSQSRLPEQKNTNKGYCQAAGSAPTAGSKERQPVVGNANTDARNNVNQQMAKRCRVLFVEHKDPFGGLNDYLASDAQRRHRKGDEKL